MIIFVNTFNVEKLNSSPSTGHRLQIGANGGIIVTHNKTDLFETDSTVIKLIPAWKYLISKTDLEQILCGYIKTIREDICVGGE